MEALAAVLEASGFSAFLRSARWIYPAVNTAHVFGLALLVGSVVPMNLRLIGVWRRDIDARAAIGLLRPVAACGAGLAILTGAALFSVRPTEYVALPLFGAKMALVALGVGHALVWGGRLASAPPARQRIGGALSLAVWTLVLICGRMVGYQ